MQLVVDEAKMMIVLGKIKIQYQCYLWSPGFVNNYHPILFSSISAHFDLNWKYVWR